MVIDRFTLFHILAELLDENVWIKIFDLNQNA